MKIVSAGLMTLLLLGLCCTLLTGCGPALTCETSLVTLDETRLDAETYEEEAAETGRKVADLEQRLAEKNKEISGIENKPAQLEEKVRELNKGSGRE